MNRAKMSKGNILVIDDEEVICDLLRDSLSAEGYKVVTSQKPKDGLMIAQDNYFDLVITDLRMPEINGINVIKQIKEFDADNTVAVITGYPSYETVQEALRLGAYGYITKPFNLEEISFTVKRAVEFRRLKLANKKLMERLEQDNINLDKKVKERTKELEKLYKNMQSAYISTVKALAQAIETRDHYTHSHSEHVTRYAAAIAKEMDFTTQEIVFLKEACQLHDLGKIGVHDYVLHKPDQLSKKEWEEIKSHSLRGAEILKPLNFLDDVTTLIRQHHERYDGTGYPDGLKREEIKLGSRIIAVADAYDAMTSERPYRKAYFHKEAVSILRKYRGTQFDPQVVNVFLRVLRKNPKLSKSKPVK